MLAAAHSGGANRSPIQIVAELAKQSSAKALPLLYKAIVFIQQW